MASMFNISRNTIACGTLTLVMAFYSAIVFAADDERSITFQDDVSSLDVIKLNIPVGDVSISGTTGNNLTAVVTGSCKKDNREDCYKVLKELNWSKKTGGITEFALKPSGITNYNNMNMKVKLSVPNDKKLEIDVSAGELRIDGTSACLTATVNAGEIKINLKESQLASAELDAKVGDVKLISAQNHVTEGDRSLLVGASLEWNKGTGACHTKASILAGEAQLVLSQ